MAQNDGTTLMTVQELAGLLRLKPSWVYAHADELGAYRLGKYLRFDVTRVIERLDRGAVGSSSVNPPTQRPPVTSSTNIASQERGTIQEQKNN
jgi:hypothetical protein